MMRISVLLVSLSAAVAFGAPDAAAPTLLLDGAVVRAEMARGQSVWVAKVEVPEDAEALGVALSGASDVNLFLRRSRPAVEDLAGEAEASAQGPSPQEVLALTAFSEARLVPGTWWVTVENPTARARGVEIEVVAFVDRPDRPRTLLPGRTVSATLPGAGGAVDLRAFLPRRSHSMDLGFRARDARDSRFTLEGPEGYERRGPGLPRLVVARSEAPAGVYTVRLESTPSAGDRRVTATTTWDLGNGRRLPGDEDPLLEPGARFTSVLGGEGNPDRQALRISVPRDSAGFALKAVVPEGSHVDVDLYVRRERKLIEPDYDADYLGLASKTSDGVVERLVVAGTRPLQPGTYHAEARLLDTFEPVEVTVALERLPAAGGGRTWGAADPPALPEGAWVAGTVKPQSSAVTWHSLELPAGARGLHARVVESSAPVDLLLARSVDGAVFQRALTARVDERLDVEFPAPLPEPRRFLLGVLSRDAEERLVDYRVAWGVRRPPSLPADLVWPPKMDVTGMRPIERTAAAIVDILIDDRSGGSGTCISPRGLILTCRHVIQGDSDGEFQHEGILIAFPRRLDQPAVQAFTARVVTEDADLDLALLRIDQDVYGRDLPPDLRLPWLPLGRSGDLRLGDPLIALGFPESGSAHLRTAIVISRGIVAGLERVPGEPPWLKTDAWIGSGHSGGALVDSEGHLVAVPAATLGEHERLGLGIPVEVLPASWRSRIDREVRGE